MGDSSRKSRYFRVLIIGRANSGKTTILRAVCGSEDEPEVYPLGSKLPNHRGRRLSFFQSPLRFWRDKPAASLSPTEERGIHNIKDQLLFSSNPGFIFHDSQGFEMGSAAELEVVQNFIKERIEAGKESFQEQLHAIWYCIPTDSTRPFTTAERIFFDECNTGEEVPVVVIFTKCDSLLVQAFRKLRDEGLSADDARKQAPGRVDQWFDEIYTPFIRERRYPPAGEVRLQDMHENKHEQVQLAMRSLISKTVSTLRGEAPRLLLISVQQNNVELCMISAIESGHITETVNDVLKAGITSFPKEYKYHKFEKFLWGIIQWFAYFWNKKDHFDYYHRDIKWASILLQLQQPRSWFSFHSNLKQLHDILSPVCADLAGSLPVNLQVLNLGAAIIIVAARTFWLQSREATPSDFQISLGQYMSLGIADKVRNEILEAFGGAGGEVYTSDEQNARLLQIVLENQMGLGA